MKEIQVVGTRMICDCLTNEISSKGDKKEKWHTNVVFNTDYLRVEEIITGYPPENAYALIDKNNKPVFLIRRL